MLLTADASRPLRRIAFLLSSLKFGGGERVALSLAKAMKANGYEIDIVLMSYEGEFLPEANREFNVIDLQCTRTWKLPFKLSSYLWRRKPHALISSFWKLNLCASVARVTYPDTKLALWEHSPPSRSQNSPRWLYSITASLFYRLATRVVCVSSGVAADVRHITWGLSPIVCTIFNPIPGPTRVFINATRIVTKKIVWIGRLDVPKNPGLMLEAFALLPKEADYELHFVGDGSLRATLEQRSQALGMTGSVRFHGFQADPYVNMASSDLLVLSSDREGFGNVLVEALHMGLRVVSTDCGQGVHDILLDNRYGVIVPVNNKQALAKAIEQVLNQSHDSQAQMDAAKRFEPGVIANQFLQALKMKA
jgi:glycosyltransferase involved in cell wall biosynthesis